MKVKEVFKQLLDDGFNVRVSTNGSSMFPLITTGDKITVSPGKNFIIGNLIVFTKDDQMFCHRLVKIFEIDGLKHYQTQGDSFFGLDEPVTAGQILGRVTGIERENVSLARRILILIHPILKFSRFNALVIAILIKLKSTCRLPNSY